MTLKDDDFSLPSTPPNMPRVKPSRLFRWLGRRFLKVNGWRVVGQLPDVPRLVMIVAPHSSNWDGVWGMATKIALGFEVKVLAKSSLFWWPLSLLLDKLGVIPLDRSSPQGTVRQAVNAIRGAEKMWFVVTPEGTRRRVEQWKSGFWKIARAADVPIYMCYFHYPEKIIGLGEIFHPTDNFETDMAYIRDYYRPWIGKTRGTV